MLLLKKKKKIYIYSLKHFTLDQEVLRILTNHYSLLSVVQEREPASPVRGLHSVTPQPFSAPLRPLKNSAAMEVGSSQRSL